LVTIVLTKWRRAKLTFFEARHKGYQFAPQVLFVTEEAAELNFTAIAVRKILLLEESLSEK